MRIHSLRRLRGALALGVALAAAPLTAQQPTPSQPNQSAPNQPNQPAPNQPNQPNQPNPGSGAIDTVAKPQPATPDTARPRVDSVLTRRAGMGDVVRIVTTNAVIPGARGADMVPQLVLYLNGRAMKGSAATLVGRNPERWEVELRRDTAAADAWRILLGSPRVTPDSVRVGLGPAAGPEYASPNEGKSTLSLVVLRPGWLWITVLLWIVVLVLFVVLARTTGIIRDSTPPESVVEQPGASDPPGGETPIPGNPLRNARRQARRALETRPYSLGRSQMAFWFFLVTATFLVIWMATGDHRGVITWNSLLLLGLASSAGVAARIIENRDRAEQRAAATAITRLRGKLDVAGKHVKVLDEVPETELQADPERALASTELAAVLNDTKPAPRSRGFFHDIISDLHDPSLARFQHVVWTVILGAVFVTAAYRTLALPDLDPVLLVLMGISGGTYVGFKAVEHGT